MKGFSAAADPGIQKAVLATAAASGGAAWWTAAKEIALELFGVPVQVVLAAATAAFFAGSFIPTMGYRMALFVGLGWTMLGTYGAQLALSLLGGWLSIQIPTGALAGGAMVVSGLGRLFITKENIDKARAAIGRYFDGIGRKP